MSTFRTSDEQRRILQQDGNVLVEAGAGSGKTTLLTLAAGTNQTEILRVRALTFSRSGKASLQDKLAEFGIQGVQVQTFDELAVAELGRCLVDDAKHVQREWVIENVLPQVVREVNEGNAGRDAVQLPTDAAGLSDLLDTFRTIRASMLGDFLEDADEEEIAGTLGRPASVWQAWCEYERQRLSWRVPGGLGFRLIDDACHDLLVAQRNSALFSPAGIDTDWLLVDEFHDTSPLQLAWLAAWAGGVRRVLAVGDRDQVLYAWRGADAPSVFAQFRQLFAPVTVLPLTASYRFGPALAAKVTPLRSRGLPALTGAGDNTRVDAVQMPLADLLASLQPQDTAIVCRDRTATVGVQLALLEKGLPFYTLDNYPCWRGAEGLLTQALAQLCAPDWTGEPPTNDRQQSAARQRRIQLVRRLASLPGVPLTLAETDELAAFAAETGNWIEVLSWLRALPAPATPAAARAHAELNAGWETLATAPADTPPSDRLEAFAAAARLERHLSLFSPAGEPDRSRVTGWRALVATIRNCGDLPGDWLSRCVALNFAHWRAAQAPAQAFAVGSVFHAKGRQWETVLVPGLTARRFPLAGQPGDEERNRAYVAMTRARSRLLLQADPDEQPSTYFA